ncbi:Rho-GAP domain-containing protein [Entamoeba marina]
MRSAPVSPRQSKDTFVINAKRNQLLVENIRNVEKDLLKKIKKILTAHTGIALSDSMKSVMGKFEESDVSNIQRVSLALQQCGDIVLDFVQIMDQLQLDLDKYLCESIKNLIDEELNIAANVPKIESLKFLTGNTNPKLSSAVANSQMAIDKFEIETLGQYINVYQSFNSFNNNMETITKLNHDVEIAKKHHTQYQKAYEENSKSESSSYRNYFGIPLSNLLANENRMNSQIPLGLEKALKYLYSNGLDKEGLFRKSSTVDQISYMKMRFLAISYTNEDPYLVASLIKEFLKEIPGGLIPKTALPKTHNWYGLCLYTDLLKKQQETPNQSNKLATQISAEIPLLLPMEHYTCLKYVIAFMSALVRNENSLMTSETIATCLAPSLFYVDDSLQGQELLNFSLECNEVFAFLIDNVNYIFSSAKRCFTGRKKSVFLSDPTTQDDPVDSFSPSSNLNQSPVICSPLTKPKQQNQPQTTVTKIPKE